MKLSKFLIIYRMLPPSADWSAFHNIAKHLRGKE